MQCNIKHVFYWSGYPVLQKFPTDILKYYNKYINNNHDVTIFNHTQTGKIKLLVFKYE